MSDIDDFHQPKNEGEPSSAVRARVIVARGLQEDRSGKSNAALEQREVTRHCALAREDARLLEQATDRLGLSARAYHRILKVARTIADLAGSEGIRSPHLTEAIGYRRLDRSG
jgi:magnesium chelatase family protein